MYGAIHACVDVGGQTVGDSSLLACGSWASNSGHQVCWQANSPALDLVMLHRRQEDRLEVFSRKQAFCFSSEENRVTWQKHLHRFPPALRSGTQMALGRSELTVGRLPWGLSTPGHNNCTQQRFRPIVNPLRVGLRLEAKSYSL